MTPKERFLAKVQPEPNTGCWLWDGATHPKGYGHIRWKGKTARASRVSYELYKGNIPNGLQIDHLCCQPACVNPDHLEAVTPKENTLRGKAGQQFLAVTHCPQGHAYDDKNTYHSVTRRNRKCRACGREYARKKRAIAAAKGDPA